MKRGSKTSSFGTTSRISHDSSQYYNSKLYSGMGEITAFPPFPTIRFPRELEDSIILGSSEDMRAIPDNSVQSDGDLTSLQRDKGV